MAEYSGTIKERKVKAGGIMGRKIICPECNTIFDEDVLKQRNSETICLVCGKSLLGDDNNSEHEESSDNNNSEQDGWITWYYYGMKDKKGNKTKTTSLRDKPINLEEFGDIYFLIQEFKAPPRDLSGSSERAKEILRTYIPDAFVYPEKKEPEIRCPRCFSTEYTLLNKGYSIFTGFLGSGRVKRVCNYCKKEF